MASIVSSRLRAIRTVRATTGAAVLAAAVAIFLFTPAVAPAHVGAGLLQVDGVHGGWKGRDFKDSFRIEAHYWGSEGKGSGIANLVASRGRGSFRRSRLVYSGPAGPKSGADRLVIAIDKRNPALRQLLQRCASHTVIPQVTFYESSMLVRGLRELGPRPADMPEYFEYRLTDVQFSDCPVVADAPQQAFVVDFKNVEWRNYSGDGMGVDNKLQPAVLKPLSTGGSTRTFVVSWFAVANDVSDNQCPVMNKKPTEDDYYALMPAEQAARERAERAAGKGAVQYENGEMELRGPSRLNATLLPGVVRDPGHAEPQTEIARGLDLDGDDGHGRPPAGVCKHRNYRSEDGRSGIDNQLYRVEGCMPGHQGHKGFLMQYRNEQRRNGLLSILVQISGIDDERNDDSVDVTILYSKDPMAKNAAGTQMLSDYTFRVTDSPEYTHYFTHLRGRIVNGVIETERTPMLQIQPGLDPEVTLYQAGMRFQIQADGTLKGIAAGYQDWRREMMLNSNSNSESLYGFQAPGLYNAYRRNADGLKDPVTGECNGISAAYDIEGVPAFIPPRQSQVQMAQSAGGAAAGH